MKKVWWRGLRWLFWKLSGRDVLVLRPDWAPLSRTAEYTLVGRAATDQLLPVRYNYHTPKRWQLKYSIPGRGAERLEYRLRAPGKDVFCRVTKSIDLPLELTIILQDDQISWNGEPVPLVPGTTLPRDTAWLEAEWIVTSAAGLRRQRTVGHRIRLSRDEVDAHDQAYFNGSVYEDYEASSGMCPRQILETIGSYRPLEGRLLDVGCATGLLVAYARQQNLEADGIDVSPWAVERANQRHPRACRVLSFDHATRADFDASYDIVILHSVLEHLADPARALRLLFEITRPGAVVYIQTLNANSLLHLLQKSDWCGYTDYTHLSPWLTEEWLAAEAAQVGFSVRASKCYGVWNDNRLDPVWRSFGALVQLHPANVLLEERYGDFTEAVLQRPLG